MAATQFSRFQEFANDVQMLIWSFASSPHNPIFLSQDLLHHTVYTMGKQKYPVVLPALFFSGVFTKSIIDFCILPPGKKKCARRREIITVPATTQARKVMLGLCRLARLVASETRRKEAADSNTVPSKLLTERSFDERFSKAVKEKAMVMLTGFIE